MIIGQEVFWRWKGDRTSYIEAVVLATNGKLIALGDSEYSSISDWLNTDEIELIVKDMSKE